MDSYNPNAWASAEDYLALSSADAALFQETRETSEDKCKRLERGAWLKGWAAAIGLATKTPAGGASAGVAVLARKGTGLTTDEGQAVGKQHAERLKHAWLGGVQKGGVHLISYIYGPAKGCRRGTSPCCIA